MRVLSAVAALALAAGVQAQHAHQHAHGHKPPAVEQGVFGLDVYRDSGVIHQLTAEQRGEAASLWHRSSRDGGLTWSAPVRADGGRAPRFTRRGDDAQVAARGQTVLALWSVPGTGWGGSGPFASALSRDGGASWAPGGNPSDSGLTTGHGFTDLAAGEQGFHAVWLDSRSKAQGLYYARSADGVKWLPNQTIAPTTCECCWNSLLLQRDEVHVMYRAKDPRDMEIATLKGAAWQRRGAVAPFDWRIRGCPETGGALVAAGGGLHALVWTGTEKNVGVHVARADAALRWSPPRRLGGAAAQHGDLAAEGVRLAAAWDEGGAIRYAASDDAGGSWSAARELAAPAARATNPRVVSTGDAFLVLWTQPGADGRWTLETRRLR